MIIIYHAISEGNVLFGFFFTSLLHSTLPFTRATNTLHTATMCPVCCPDPRWDSQQMKRVASTVGKGQGWGGLGWEVRDLSLRQDNLSAMAWHVSRSWDVCRHIVLGGMTMGIELMTDFFYHCLLENRDVFVFPYAYPMRFMWKIWEGWPNGWGSENEQNKFGRIVEVLLYLQFTFL